MCSLGKVYKCSSETGFFWAFSSCARKLLLKFLKVVNDVYGYLFFLFLCFFQQFSEPVCTVASDSCSWLWEVEPNVVLNFCSLFTSPHPPVVFERCFFLRLVVQSGCLSYCMSNLSGHSPLTSLIKNSFCLANCCLLDIFVFYTILYKL